VRRRTALLLLAAGVLVGSACGDDGGDDDSGSGTTTTATADEGTTTTARSEEEEEEGERPVGEPTRGPIETAGFPSDGSRAGRRFVDLRVAGHRGFDRVVFEFEDGVPGYRIDYVEPPVREDGSGEPVAVDGSAFLQVIMTATGVDLSGPTPEELYTGPDRIDPAGTAVVDELVQTGDFEATLTWALGLDAEVELGVAELDDPARLVLDLRSPEG
jgi:hypothetical protein